MRDTMTILEAYEWLHTTEVMRAEYSTLAVLDDRTMRGADRNRLNELSRVLVVRNQQCEDVLRAVIAGALPVEGV